MSVDDRLETAAGHLHTTTPPLLVQTVALSARAVRGFLRQPQLWIPGIIFPLLLAAVNSSSLSRVSLIPGFPPDTSYLQFLVVSAIVQGVMFGAIASGNELTIDIQNGFFERLLSAPVSRPAILFGRIAGGWVFAAFQAVLFIGILWPFGGTVRGGLPGVLVLVALAVFLATAIGGLAAGLGARTGEPEAVQGFFPLVFILLFMSSAFFPTALMSGWYATIAENNPLTWMIDGARYQVIVGFDLTEAAKALLISGALALLGLWFALAQVRRRWRVAS